MKPIFKNPTFENVAGSPDGVQPVRGRIRQVPRRTLQLHCL